MDSVLSALMEINAEKAFQLLKQRGRLAPSGSVGTDGRKEEAPSPGARSTIALWMTRGLPLYPGPGLSTATLLGARRAASANQATHRWLARV